jgi:uncharacterized protein (TIGR02271 family)
MSCEPRSNTGMRERSFYYISMRNHRDDRSSGSMQVSIPIVEEQIKVGSREVTTQRAIINKNIEEREELVDLPVLSDDYRIERIPINLTIDSRLPVRCVGDTTIIPVIDEIAIVTKQLVLREELHITRVPTELHRPQLVKLKRERVDVFEPTIQKLDIKQSGVIPMAKTIVGLFDNPQKTQMAIMELANAGFPQSDVFRITLNDNIAANGEISTSLMRAGVPREEIEHYSGEIKSGRSVLVLKVSDQAVQSALAIFERNGAKDLDQRSGSTTTAGLGGQETARLAQPEGSRTTTVPVIEEELKVDKRQVQGGGVRIFTRMAEQPIEQDVSLRQEHIDVERRPVNRPATEQDLRDFKEGTVEVMATAEEAVVSKEARVVEEVIVSKDVSEETRTIRDTVRKTEVDVDEKTGQPFRTASEQYRENIDRAPSLSGNDPALAGVGPVNDDYAYNYGRTLASDPRYQDKDWAVIEPEAQRDWDTRHKGAWEEFKEKIRQAFGKR